MASLVETVLRKTRTRPQQLESALRDRNIQQVEFLHNLSCEGSLEPVGTEFRHGFVMRLKKSAADVRIRFTMAHELCHTFFYELVPEIKFAPHETDDEEERLCNLGAAAFLVPTSALRRRVKKLQPRLETLELLSTEYRVSIPTMLLRLRALGLWHCEVSLWHRMSNGRFVLDRLYGGRRLSYQWEDISILEPAWNSNKSVCGHSFLFCEDRRGQRSYRPICYEIRRHADGLIALWGMGVGTAERPKLPPLLAATGQA
jgi:IrrE N-terminal-like domain